MTGESKQDTIVSDEMAKKFASEKETPYVRWVRDQGLDIIDSVYVKNLYTVNLKPWVRLDARIAVALRGLCDLLCLARVELVEWEDALLAAAPTIAVLSSEYVAGQAEGGMVQGGMSRGGWRVGAAAVSTGAVLVASEGLSLPTSVFGVVGALSAGAATVASASGAVSEGV
mgnify:CR=1 FL=1